MGGVVSFFRPAKSPKQVRSEAVDAGRKAREEKAKKAEEDKKMAALKLAQLATGAGGILSEAKTTRRKLLGN